MAIVAVRAYPTWRIQDIADLALIAPGILNAIPLGEQPSGLSTDQLIKTRFCTVWSDQRARLAAP